MSPYVVVPVVGIVMFGAGFWYATDHKTEDRVRAERAVLRESAAARPPQVKATMDLGATGATAFVVVFPVSKYDQRTCLVAVARAGAAATINCGRGDDPLAIDPQ